MWLDKARSERFLWFSIVVVKNLKLDLSLEQFKVEKGKHILLLLLLLLLLLKVVRNISYGTSLLYYYIFYMSEMIFEIIFMSSLFQNCNSLTFMLSWFVVVCRGKNPS